MNTAVTSKEAILSVCRRLVAEKGIPALNMRAVAGECHVALGSLYNYFPCKEDMIIAAVESVWQDIFRMERPRKADLAFPEYVGGIFEQVLRGTVEYPNFFDAHSLGFAGEGKTKAHDTMQRYFSRMKREMTEALERDAAVKSGAFSPAFTKADLVDFVLTNLQALLLLKACDCRTLKEMIRRAIY